MHLNVKDVHHAFINHYKNGEPHFNELSLSISFILSSLKGPEIDLCLHGGQPDSVVLFRFIICSV